MYSVIPVYDVAKRYGHRGVCMWVGGGDFLHKGPAIQNFSDVFLSPWISFWVDIGVTADICDDL